MPVFKVGVSGACCSKQDCTPWGAMGHLSECQEGFIIGFGLLQDDFGESSRKPGYTLNSALSEKWGNATIGYLNEFYLETEETSEVKALTGKEEDL